MDIIQFQKQRDTDLAKFKRENEALKEKYANLLSSAVNERDSEKQGELVRQLLDVNSSLASELRYFIATQSQKSVDSKAIDELTQELIAYQQDYDKLQKSKDTTTTLNMILNENNIRVSSMRFQFNVLLAVLLIGILFTIFLIFRTSGAFPTLMPTQPQSILAPLR